MKKIPRLVVIEDEAVLRMDLQERLEGLGYEVVGAGSRATEALELAARLRPDLIFMDIRLKDGPDGIVAAEVIRERHGIPIVFLTAFADDETIRRAKDTEPFGYLHKPCHDRELRSAVEVALQRHKAERALVAARESAEAVGRQQREFVAQVVHEIRSPLGVIAGFADILMNDSLPPETLCDHLGRIKHSADNLAAIVRDLLDLSRLDAGRFPLDPRPFNPHELAADALKPLAERASVKGLDLVCDLDPALPPRLVGDPGRIRQVLVNLAENALKFTERGSVLVRIEAGDPESRRSPVRFSVADTGIGIPPDRHGPIFSPFVQAGPGIADGHGGAGLGLAICAKLVALMGGTIGVESRPGSGSTFRFAIPLEAPLNLDAGDHPIPSPLPGEAPLLVAIADPALREALGRWLGRWGLASTFVEDLPGLIAAIHEHPASGRWPLVIVDAEGIGIEPRAAAVSLRDRAQHRGPAILLSRAPLKAIPDPLLIPLRKPILPADLAAALSVLAARPILSSPEADPSLAPAPDLRADAGAASS